MRKAAMLVLPSVRTSTGRVEGLGHGPAGGGGDRRAGGRLNIGGIPEGIDDGRNRVLGTGEGRDTLARRMAEVTRRSNLADEMGARARASSRNASTFGGKPNCLKDSTTASFRPARSGWTGGQSAIVVAHPDDECLW